jgi:hypothetical protein
VVTEDGPLVKDTNEADYCFKGFCYTAVGSRGEEVPGRSKDNFADNVGGEIIAYFVSKSVPLNIFCSEQQEHTP